jgi:hypothetical protein
MPEKNGGNQMNERYKHQLDLAEEYEDILKRNGVVLFDNKDQNLSTNFGEKTIERIEEAIMLNVRCASYNKRIEELMLNKDEQVFLDSLKADLNQYVKLTE